MLLKPTRHHELYFGRWTPNRPMTRTRYWNLGYSGWERIGQFDTATIWFGPWYLQISVLDWVIT